MQLSWNSGIDGGVMKKRNPVYSAWFLKAKLIEAVGTEKQFHQNRPQNVFPSICYGVFKNLKGTTKNC